MNILKRTHSSFLLVTHSLDLLSLTEFDSCRCSCDWNHRIFFSVWLTQSFSTVQLFECEMSPVGSSVWAPGSHWLTDTFGRAFMKWRRLSGGNGLPWRTLYYFCSATKEAEIQDVLLRDRARAVDSSFMTVWLPLVAFTWGYFSFLGLASRSCYLHCPA